MVMSWLLSMAFMIVYVFAFDYVTSALPSNVYYSVVCRLKTRTAAVATQQTTHSLTAILSYSQETSISATWALLSLISGITAAQDLSDFEDGT